MPPRRRDAGPPALTDDDLASLRARVAAGESPRVVVRVASAAVAAGTRGGVVRFGDPKDNEYVVVRLGRDEVPFAPSELGIPGRKPAVEPVATKRPAGKAAAPSKPARVAPGRAAAATPQAPASPSRRRRSGGRVPPLVVTMRFRDGEWTVEAQRGARRLSRPSALRPGAVSAFAEQVNDEAIRDALVETVEACRAVIEQRAAGLREQLDATEATLRDYESKPRRR
jgi:hypothetical protein